MINTNALKREMQSSLDLEKVLADPEIITGLSRRKYNDVRARFAGSDISFLTIAVWSHTGSTATAAAIFLGRHQSNVTRSLREGLNKFIFAYKSVVGSEPMRPLVEIASLEELLQRVPASAEYLRDEDECVAA